MPKKLKTFRFSKEIIESVKSYQQLHNLPSFSHAVMYMLKENDRLHLYIKYLGSIRQIQKDIPPCRRRVFHDGKYYCVQTDKKGFKRMKELPTLEICRVCKLERHKIPESTKVEKPLAQTIRNPNIQHQGMIYCINGGLWVFPSKCERCPDRFRCKKYLAYKKQ